MAESSKGVLPLQQARHGVDTPVTTKALDDTVDGVRRNDAAFPRDEDTKAADLSIPPLARHLE